MELNEEQITETLQGISIPPQPQILVDIQMEQYQPNPDINHIAKLISQDVSLAGTVLKTVNSPFFALVNTISSVTQAVNLLGIHSVINIVNGISIKGELEDSVIVELSSFWDTAQDIAHIAASVARQIGFSNPDEAYSLGLFHNVGIPMMRKKFPDYFDVMRESYSGKHERIIDLENEHYQTNHAVIGYYVGKSWRLPKPVCDAIADHHNMKLMLTERLRTEELTLLCILKIAEHLANNALKLGKQNTDIEWESNSEELLTFVGLGEYDLENMGESFRDQGLDIISVI